MNYVFRQAICAFALCLLFGLCFLAGCQQDPTIVEIVYVQEETSGVLSMSSQSQSLPGANAPDADLPCTLSDFPADADSAGAGISEAPAGTINPLIQPQLPTPFLPLLTPSPLATPFFLPTPTPAQTKAPVPTPSPSASPPSNTPTPEPAPSSQGNDLERERLTAAYEERVRSIQRAYADKINSLQGMLSSLEASLAANPDYAAEIQQEIQATQGQLQGYEAQQAQELQAAQAEYQAALGALG